MEKSILTKDQKKTITFNNLSYDGQKVDLIINLRYDDQCGNGHNSFSITGDLYEARKRSDRACICCGCIHDIIKELAPEYSKYIKWHLMSSDEPMHYIANTLYLANEVKEFTNFVYLNDDEFNFKELIGIFKDEDIVKIKAKYGEKNIIVETKAGDYNREADLEGARRTAIAPNATLEQLRSEKWLKARLPKLRREFKAMVEELGFIY